MSVQTEITRIESAKTAIATAIAGKGVTVPEGTKLDGMAALVESIEAGGVGVQSDWNQNDETAADYVKNRPFYTGDPVETVFVEESTVSFVDNDGLYMAEFPSTFAATVGETYKVSWDGTTYECACVNVNNIPFIGNFSMIGAGSDTGEPFVIGVFPDDHIEIFTADTSASHTISISGFVPEIVKIPAKFIDKDASGYIAIHKNSTMTEEEAQNYEGALLKGEAVFIIWDVLYISGISVQTETDSTGVSVVCLYVYTPNGESYRIAQNSEGLFNCNDRKLYVAVFPNNKAMGDVSSGIDIYSGKIRISSSRISSGVGTTDALFLVRPNGIKSKAFEVLGNGEAVAPAIILYSSTAGSTKKFKITVDDNGVPTITDESDSTNTWKPTNLPTVTSSDSGKFLRVSDTGEWVTEMQDGSATDTVVTASASAWSNNTITLSVTGVMADSKLEIGLSNTATDEQFTVAAAAQIRATSSGDGTVTLKAVAAPSVDLPILIRRLS